MFPIAILGVKSQLAFLLRPSVEWRPAVSPPTERAHLRLPSADRALVFLLCFILLLGVLHLISRYSGRLTVFDLDREANFPTWFAAAQWLCLAGLLVIVSGRERVQGHRSEATATAVLAVLCGFFSLDEAAGLHERLADPAGRSFALPLYAGGHVNWLLIYAVIGLALLLLISPGLWRYARDRFANTWRFAAGAIMVLAGGVGVEILFYEQIFYGTYQVLVEEVLELCGVSVMLWACLRDLQSAPVLVDTSPPSTRTP